MADDAKQHVTNQDVEQIRAALRSKENRNWTRRFGSGECYKCGKALGHYDSKWLEQNGSRMVCYDCGWSKAVHGWPSLEHVDWWYYTDG